MRRKFAARRPRCQPLREGVEDVLAAERQRHVAGERDAGFQVDDVPAVQQQRVGAADEARVEVVDPGAVVVQAGEHPDPRKREGH